MKGTYYNEWEPYPAQWLRNLISAGLIPAGDVDERSICDVHPDDLRGYGQCHFFAGIGGWAYAARLAGWPDDREIWTGSCPCQPFSACGPRTGFSDPRHLWPQFKRLISQRRPPVVFGEQSSRASAWLALVRCDLEEMGYAVGAIPIEAASVGARHLRERYWFVAHLDSDGKHAFAVNAEMAISSTPSADTDGTRLEIVLDRETEKQPPTLGASFWSSEPGVGIVAYGIPDRMAKIRALGNAIVPQVAVEVIAAFMEHRP